MKRCSLADLLHDGSGQDIVEYALVATLVGLTCMAAMRNVTTAVNTVFVSVSSTLSSAL